MIGSANVSDNKLADKIDLFGWSGRIGSAKWGISTSKTISDYAGSFADWGTNAIGTSAANTYRTLTKDEWEYLLNSRDNASEKKGVARIHLNGDGSQYANGLILLPDSWVLPEGVAFKSGFADSYDAEAYATYQTFTFAQWQKLEAAGAVFLPGFGLPQRVGYERCADLRQLLVCHGGWLGLRELPVFPLERHEHVQCRSLQWAISPSGARG